MEVLAAVAWSLFLGQLLLCPAMSLAAQGYLEGVEPRPLWILDDGLAKRQRQDRPGADYATTTIRQPLMRRQARGGGQEPGPITFLVRHDEGEDVEQGPPPARRRMPTLPQRRFMMPHRLQLPHQYVQPNQRIRSSSRSSSNLRRTGGRHLPVFDNAPGENTLRTGRDNYPIFVYNGTRGELILNTMLSRRRYPMQEPVPGQVLYPPSTPMFRPKPIVERFRLPGRREMLNLTLIPFYAHEAIANPSHGATEAPSTTQASPSPSPMPPYETQLPRSQEQVLSQRKRKRKKAKQYEAFHSPQEVMQWQSVLRRQAHGHDRDNHRHYSSEERQPHQQEQEHEELLLDEEDQEEQEEQQEEALLTSHDWVTEQETETEMELPPETEPETSTSPSSGGPFQIVYLDDSLERPVTSSSSSTTSTITSTTTDPPPALRQSSRYALKREYYAFPVYTLGKLLQPQAKKLLEKSDRAARSSSERGPNTWFILNSRYKGPIHRASLGSENQTKYYTSKYMESGFRPRR